MDIRSPIELLSLRDEDAIISLANSDDAIESALSGTLARDDE